MNNHLNHLPFYSGEVQRQQLMHLINELSMAARKQISYICLVNWAFETLSAIAC